MRQLALDSFDRPVSPALPPRPDFARETHAFTRGAKIVVGVDEAGRGPLAGPVVCAAVMLDPARIPGGLDDSKKLRAADRAVLFEAIAASARLSVAVAGVAEIDRLNIRGATLAAMARAVGGLGFSPCIAFVDGRDRPAVSCDCEAIVDGDALCLSIAAASIVAKVTRDRLMERLCRRFPGYGFSQHKGYGTPEHQAALARLGPCAIHRRSFAPVRNLLQEVAHI